MGSTLANYFTIHNEAARSPPDTADKEGDDEDYFEEDNVGGKKSEGEAGHGNEGVSALTEGRDTARWLMSSPG